MFQIKRILFPVDFSGRCRGAAAYVEALAGRFEAELILLHVIEATYNTALDDLQIPPGKFDQFFGDDLNFLRVIRRVEHGEAARKIVECASAHHVDLIMIPTQGMGIYRRLILGSTSAKVLHDADCPVWTGVHLEDAPRLDALACRRILCAVDLGVSSGTVLDWAQHLAEEYQADLTLLHVTENPEARSELDDLQRTVGSHATVRLESGEPSKIVPYIAAELSADLLVIGRKAEAGIFGRLEATAYSIIRQSPCPVISV